MTASNIITLYQTSDIHARRGFGPRLASLVESSAALVDCGDALAGSSVVYRPKEDVIKDHALAPYRAFAVGNREFHYLHSLFKARAQRLPAPLVCSNLIDLRSREPLFRRELVITVNAVMVRLLAMLVPQYRTGSGWERIFGWRFLAPDVAMAELMRDGKGAAAGIPTIVLSHLGLPADRALAARWPTLSAILGGHTHATMSRPLIVGEVPIVHVGAYAASVGRLELDVAAARARVASYELLPLRGNEVAAPVPVHGGSDRT